MPTRFGFVVHRYQKMRVARVSVLAIGLPSCSNVKKQMGQPGRNDFAHIILGQKW